MIRNHYIHNNFWNNLPQIQKGISSFGKTQYVEAINFFPISRETLSVELKFKEKVSVDIFYLDNPGRLVIDIKS